LVVAGGTFWSKPKWEGGEKRWTQAIYTLGPGETEWRRSGDLPDPIAYGGAVSTNEGVVCIGGQRLAAASGLVHLLYWDGSRIRCRRLADLPDPRMMLAAAPMGGSVVALGGQSSPTATVASSEAWVLEAVNGDWARARWQPAPPIPGYGRILPGIAGCRDKVCVVSGAALSEKPHGGASRTYLRDGFRLRHGTGWARLPDLPAPVVAAPACCDANGRFLVFGGDDGALGDKAAELGPRHPGFRRTILRLEDGGWREAGSLPESLVTSGAVSWLGSVVIPGGENLPGTRTARVLSIQGLT
jgi:hypothetical protein